MRQPLALCDGHPCKFGIAPALEFRDVGFVALGDAEHRAIYGEASAEEAKALSDEGIDVMPLPTLPDDRN